MDRAPARWELDQIKRLKARYYRLQDGRGTWALFCGIELPRPDGPPARVDIFGYYHDEYRKDADGQWRIHRMRYANAMTSGVSEHRLR